MGNETGSVKRPREFAGRLVIVQAMGNEAGSVKRAHDLADRLVIIGRAYSMAQLNIQTKLTEQKHTEAWEVVEEARECGLLGRCVQELQQRQQDGDVRQALALLDAHYEQHPRPEFR
jgi:hypothetical protein